MGLRWIVFVLTAGIAAPGGADAAPRCTEGKRPEVFVRPKTPVRRGPGLNYQVSRFLERGRCLSFSEVSMDQGWVLIEHSDGLGWVPMGRLSKRAQEKVRAKPRKQRSAVGSAQARVTTRVKRQSILLDRPDPEASPRRVLPRDVEVVPLAMTDDGRWVQVRDERGDVGWILMTRLRGDALSDLPVMTEGFDRGVMPIRDGEAVADSASRSDSEAQGRSDGGSKDPTPRGQGHDSGVDGDRRSGRGASELIGGAVRAAEGIGLTGFVLAGAVVPVHQLDSNAQVGRRRYDLAAFSPALALQLELTDLGPFALRASYLFGLLLGVAPDDANAAGMGQQHQGSLRFGIPLDLGAVLLTPELGYSFGWFDFDSILPDDPRFFTVVSSQGHMGAAGARAHWRAARRVTIEGEAAFLMGATLEAPRDLGDNSLALGFEGGLSAHFLLDDTLGLVARYLVKLRRTRFSGGNELDPTLTEATLIDLSHGLVVGLSFIL